MSKSIWYYDMWLTWDLERDEVLDDWAGEVGVLWAALQTLVVLCDGGRVAQRGDGGVPIHRHLDNMTALLSMLRVWMYDFKCWNSPQYLLNLDT